MSPWLTLAELAEYIRCLGRNGGPSPNGARMWAKRHGIVPGRRGRRLLYARADVDAALTGGRHLRPRPVWVYGRRAG